MALSFYMSQAPGVFMEEVPSGPRPIQAVGTSTAGFVGVAPDAGAQLNKAVAIDNWSQFVKLFVPERNPKSTPLSHAVYGFLQNGGRRCYVVNVGAGGNILGTEKPRSGLRLLEEVDEVAIVAAPGYTDPGSYNALLTHCENMKDRVVVLDAPAEVDDVDQLKEAATEDEGAKPKGLRPRVSERGYGAFYFPWIRVVDPLSTTNERADVAPSGHIAGIYARTDATRGVHKPPANESVRGALGVKYRVTAAEQGALNQAGVNCIRTFPREGILLWGGRTVADAASEWRYLNVRRLFNMVEESIVQSTRWVVFEPNDQALWKAIRRDVRAFLTLVWRDGAFMGATPEEAFFVKCDAETNPPEVIDAGIVVTLIGIAPVKPAEFIVFRIGQHASGTQIETF
jgi:phage tail sheath protein FI